MKRLLVLLLYVTVFGVSCASMEEVSRKKIIGSEDVIKSSIQLDNVYSSKMDEKGRVEITLLGEADATYVEEVKYLKKRKTGSRILASSVILGFGGMVLLAMPSESIQTKGAYSIIGGAAASTIWMIGYRLDEYGITVKKNITKNEKGHKRINRIKIANQKVKVNNLEFKTNSAGKVVINLEDDLKINTGHKKHAKITVEYKDDTKKLIADTREGNLEPALGRLSQQKRKFKLADEEKNNFISEYIQRKIRELKSPKTEFETQAEYEARITSIETRRDEFKAEAERKFLKTLEPTEKEIQQERNHILDIIKEPLKATFHAGDYYAEEELLQTHLVFETETPEFEIDYPISRARAASIVPQLRKQKPKADVWFNLTEEDELVISKVELDFQGEHLVYQGKGKAAPTLPPRLVVSEPQFSDTDGDNRLSAEERSLINFTITNEGEGAATGVQVLGETEASIGGLGASIGTIEPGESKSISLTAIGRGDIDTGTATIDLSINESAGFGADPIRITIPTQAYQPPKFSLHDIGVEDNRGTGIIRPGEQVDITVRIFNEGKGKAEDVSARIAVGENMFLPNQPGRSSQSYNIGTLESGEWHDITFGAFSNREADSFPVSLEITESRGEFGLITEDLGLEFQKQQRTLQELTVQANEMETNTGVAPSLTVDIAKDIPKAKQEKENAVAVIIGNRSYRGDVPDVAFALRDASLTRKYVEQALGFRPGNIIYMEDATLTDMRVVFGDENNPKGQLSDLVRKEESEVFVFYSGHGAPDVNTNDGYLMPVDGNASRLSFTGYSLNTLYENLNELEAKSVSVVIDACFSGAAGNGEMLIQQASPIGIRVNNPAAALKNGSVVTASSGSQIASWYPEKRHGLLTYFYLKGLKGDADLNQDGAITNGEMKQYLSDQNDGVPYYARRIHSRDQQPQVYGVEELIIR